jgi:hypothetical protein
MEPKFTIPNVLRISWKALISQVWALAGLMIGYVLLSFTLSAVLSPVLSSSGAGAFIFQLLNLIISLIFIVGYLKNLFQALDGDEPSFSAYGQQARKIGVYFVSNLLGGISVLIAAGLFLAPYFYLLGQSTFIGEISFDMNSGLPNLPGGHGAALCGILAGALVLLLPAFYIAIRFMFYPAFIVEEDTGIIESLKKSWEITKGQELPLFLLGLVSFGIIIAGLLLFIVGLFVAVPLIYMMFCYTFRKLKA